MQLLGLFQGLIDRRGHKVFQQLAIVLLHQRGIDPALEHFGQAVDFDLHQAAAGGPGSTAGPCSSSVTPCMRLPISWACLSIDARLPMPLNMTLRACSYVSSTATGVALNNSSARRTSGFWDFSDESCPLRRPAGGGCSWHFHRGSRLAIDAKLQPNRSRRRPSTWLPPAWPPDRDARRTPCRKYTSRRKKRPVDLARKLLRSRRLRRCRQSYRPFDPGPAARRTWAFSGDSEAGLLVGKLAEAGLPLPAGGLTDCEADDRAASQQIFFLQLARRLHGAADGAGAALARGTARSQLIQQLRNLLQVLQCADSDQGQLRQRARRRAVAQPR